MPHEKTLPPEVIASGEVGKPAFVILANPGTLFTRHARRFMGLAVGHQLESYLLFLSRLSEAQHDCQLDLPAPFPAEVADMERAYAHGMPPIAKFEPDDASDQILLAIVNQMRDAAMPDAARTALLSIGELDGNGRGAMMRAVVESDVLPENVGGHVFAAAAVQVHFTRLAAQLDGLRLRDVAPGVCPCCGGNPVASTVIELPQASGYRYCCCWQCGTLWNVPRIRCTVCGGEKGISYHHIKGIADTIQAESCQSCNSYVKLFHQEKDGAIDPVADDVASLGLDLLMREEGFHRGGANPFLMGY